MNKRLDTTVSYLIILFIKFLNFIKKALGKAFLCCILKTLGNSRYHNAVQSQNTSRQTRIKKHEDHLHSSLQFTSGFRAKDHTHCRGQTLIYQRDDFNTHTSLCFWDHIFFLHPRNSSRLKRNTFIIHVVCGLALCQNQTQSRSQFQKICQMIRWSHLMIDAACLGEPEMKQVKRLQAGC